MRKSIIGILAIAALTASVVIDNAAAQKGGGGGSGSSGGGASMGGGGGAPMGGGGPKSAPSMGPAGSPSVGGPAFTPSGPKGGRYSGNYGSGPKYNGGYRYGDRGDRHHHRRGFAFFGSPFGFYDDYAYYPYYDNGCYQMRRVHTRYGWQWRQVYVCGYPY